MLEDAVACLLLYPNAVLQLDLETEDMAQRVHFKMERESVAGVAEEEEAMMSPTSRVEARLRSPVHDMREVSDRCAIAVQIMPHINIQTGDIFTGRNSEVRD